MMTKLNISVFFDAFLLRISLNTILIVVGVFFSVLLLLGLRKSYILKKENERLSAMNNQINEMNTDETYRDFTEGHAYDSNQ